ncbi:MAG: RNA-binding protein YhbY [Sodalis sp.]|nr:MAG: RNA-binding protein YhbY [Sodalis sp.]
MLKPIVMLGNNGLAEGVFAEIKQALEHHELLKQITTEERETKTLIADAIVRESGAGKVQIILVLYRSATEQKITLSH